MADGAVPGAQGSIDIALNLTTRLEGLDQSIDKVASKFDNLTQQSNKFANSLRTVSKLGGQAFGDWYKSIQEAGSHLQSLASGMSVLEGAVGAFRKGIDSATGAVTSKLQTALQTAAQQSTAGFNQSTNAVRNLQTAMAQTAVTGQSAFGGIVQQIFGSLYGIQFLITQIRTVSNALQNMDLLRASYSRIMGANLGSGTQAAANQMMRDSQRIAYEYGSTLKEVAGVMVEFARQGRSVQEVAYLTEQIGQLRLMLATSTGKFLSMNEAMKSATTLMTQMDLTVYQSIDALKLMAEYDIRAATSFNQISDAMNRFASAGKIAGMSVNEIVRVATAFTEIGVGASRAGTALNSTLSRLAGTKKAMDALDAVGYSLTTVEAGTIRATSAFERLVDAYRRVIASGSSSQLNTFLSDIAGARQRSVVAAGLNRYIKQTTSAVSQEQFKDLTNTLSNALNQALTLPTMEVKTSTVAFSHLFDAEQVRNTLKSNVAQLLKDIQTEFTNYGRVTRPDLTSLVARWFGGISSAEAQQVIASNNAVFSSLQSAIDTYMDSVESNFDRYQRYAEATTPITKQLQEQALQTMQNTIAVQQSRLTSSLESTFLTSEFSGMMNSGISQFVSELSTLARIIRDELGSALSFIGGGSASAGIRNIIRMFSFLLTVKTIPNAVFSLFTGLGNYVSNLVPFLSGAVATGQRSLISVWNGIRHPIASFTNMLHSGVDASSILSSRNQLMTQFLAGNGYTSNNSIVGQLNKLTQSSQLSKMGSYLATRQQFANVASGVISGTELSKYLFQLDNMASKYGGFIGGVGKAVKDVNADFTKYVNTLQTVDAVQRGVLISSFKQASSAADTTARSTSALSKGFAAVGSAVSGVVTGIGSFLNIVGMVLALTAFVAGAVRWISDIGKANAEAANGLTRLREEAELAKPALEALNRTASTLKETVDGFAKALGQYGTALAKFLQNSTVRGTLVDAISNTTKRADLVDLVPVERKRLIEEELTLNFADQYTKYVNEYMARQRKATSEGKPFTERLKSETEFLGDIFGISGTVVDGKITGPLEQVADVWRVMTAAVGKELDNFARQVRDTANALSTSSANYQDQIAEERTKLVGEGRSANVFNAGSKEQVDYLTDLIDRLIHGQVSTDTGVPVLDVQAENFRNWVDNVLVKGLERNPNQLTPSNIYSGLFGGEFTRNALQRMRPELQKVFDGLRSKGLFPDLQGLDEQQITASVDSFREFLLLLDRFLATSAKYGLQRNAFIHNIASMQGSDLSQWTSTQYGDVDSSRPNLDPWRYNNQDAQRVYSYLSNIARPRKEFSHVRDFARALYEIRSNTLPFIDTRTNQHRRLIQHIWGDDIFERVAEYERNHPKIHTSDADRFDIQNYTDTTARVQQHLQATDNLNDALGTVTPTDFDIGPTEQLKKIMEDAKKATSGAKEAYERLIEIEGSWREAFSEKNPNWKDIADRQRVAYESYVTALDDQIETTKKMSMYVEKLKLANEEIFTNNPDQIERLRDLYGEAFDPSAFLALEKKRDSAIAQMEAILASYGEKMDFTPEELNQFNKTKSELLRMSKEMRMHYADYEYAITKAQKEYERVTKRRGITETEKSQAKQRLDAAREAAYTTWKKQVDATGDAMIALFKVLTEARQKFTSELLKLLNVGEMTIDQVTAALARFGLVQGKDYTLDQSAQVAVPEKNAQGQIIGKPGPQGRDAQNNLVTDQGTGKPYLIELPPTDRDSRRLWTINPENINPTTGKPYKVNELPQGVFTPYTTMQPGYNITYNDNSVYNYGVGEALYGITSRTPLGYHFAPEVKDQKITSAYGAQEKFRSHSHGGVDYKMPEGTPLKLPAFMNKAEVVKINTNPNVDSGRSITLRFDYGGVIYQMVLMHLQEIDKNIIDQFNKNGRVPIDAGQILGKSGKSGKVTGPHLHLQLDAVVKDQLKRLDPEILSKLNTGEIKPGSEEYDIITQALKARIEDLDKQIESGKDVQKLKNERRQAETNLRKWTRQVSETEKQQYGAQESTLLQNIQAEESRRQLINSLMNQIMTDASGRITSFKDRRGSIAAEEAELERLKQNLTGRIQIMEDLLRSGGLSNTKVGEQAREAAVNAGLQFVAQFNKVNQLKAALENADLKAALEDLNTPHKYSVETGDIEKLNSLLREEYSLSLKIWQNEFKVVAGNEKDLQAVKRRFAVDILNRYRTSLNEILEVVKKLNDQIAKSQELGIGGFDAYLQAQRARYPELFGVNNSTQMFNRRIEAIERQNAQSTQSLITRLESLSATWNKSTKSVQSVILTEVDKLAQVSSISGEEAKKFIDSYKALLDRLVADRKLTEEQAKQIYDLVVQSFSTSSGTSLDKGKIESLQTNVAQKVKDKAKELGIDETILPKILELLKVEFFDKLIASADKSGQVSKEFATEQVNKIKEALKGLGVSDEVLNQLSSMLTTDLQSMFGTGSLTATQMAQGISAFRMGMTKLFGNGRLAVEVIEELVAKTVSLSDLFTKRETNSLSKIAGQALAFIPQEIPFTGGAGYRSPETAYTASSTAKLLRDPTKFGSVTGLGPEILGTLKKEGRKLPNLSDLNKWLEYLQVKATEAEIDPFFLAALIMHESHWDTKAKSPAGALGLAQFMPNTLKQYGATIKDAYDPFKSIDLIIAYMKNAMKLSYIGSNPDINKLTVAYNAGPGSKRIPRDVNVPLDISKLSPQSEPRRHNEGVWRYFTQFTKYASSHSPVIAPKPAPKPEPEPVPTKPIQPASPDIANKSADIAVEAANKAAVSADQAADIAKKVETSADITIPVTTSADKATEAAVKAGTEAAKAGTEAAKAGTEAAKAGTEVAKVGAPTPQPTPTPPTTPTLETPETPETPKTFEPSAAENLAKEQQALERTAEFLNGMIQEIYEGKLPEIEGKLLDGSTLVKFMVEGANSLQGVEKDAAQKFAEWYIQQLSAVAIQKLERYNEVSLEGLEYGAVIKIPGLGKQRLNTALISKVNGVVAQVMAQFSLLTAEGTNTPEELQPIIEELKRLIPEASEEIQKIYDKVVQNYLDASGEINAVGLKQLHTVMQEIIYKARLDPKSITQQVIGRIAKLQDEMQNAIESSLESGWNEGFDIGMQYGFTTEGWEKMQDYMRKKLAHTVKDIVWKYIKDPLSNFFKRLFVGVYDQASQKAIDEASAALEQAIATGADKNLIADLQNKLADAQKNANFLGGLFGNTPLGSIFSSLFSSIFSALIGFALGALFTDYTSSIEEAAKEQLKAQEDKINAEGFGWSYQDAKSNVATPTYEFAQPTTNESVKIVKVATTINITTDAAAAMIANRRELQRVVTELVQAYERQVSKTVGASI